MLEIEPHLVLGQLAQKHPGYMRVQELTRLSTPKGQAPLLRFEVTDLSSLGATPLESRPIFGIFAGVHGIEAIGVKVLLAFIEHVVAQTSWNSQLSELLRHVRIVGVPVVNPWGYVSMRRSNSRGIDLMRNAPVESPLSVPFVGGHRLSATLPYYRGDSGLEAENLGVIGLVEQDLWKAPFSLTLDIHSGFGREDHLWTPYAKEKGFPPLWQHYRSIQETLDRTLKNHVYRFGPQSRQYCTAGDLWDYLFDEAMRRPSNGLFLPLTLEIGSWAWLLKSPSKALLLRNLFNPAHPHRERRVLRRHLPLLNFLLNVVADFPRVLGLPMSRIAA